MGCFVFLVVRVVFFFSPSSLYIIESRLLVDLELVKIFFPVLKAASSLKGALWHFAIWKLFRFIIAHLLIVGF